MDELEQQIKAWADAAAPSADGGVSAAEVMAGTAAGGGSGEDALVSLDPAGPSWGRRLAIAAAVLVVVAVGVAVAAIRGDGPEPVRADRPTTTTSDPDGTSSMPDGTTTVTTDPPTGEVTFEVLAVEPASAAEPMGTLRYAAREGTFLELWNAAGRHLPLPDIDFDEQVVVSIIIPDDACPPTLAGFKRDGPTIEPRFVEPEGGCVLPLIPKTFIIALDRSTTGSQFELFLPGQETYDFGDQRLEIDLDAEPKVTATLELDAATVKAGGEIKGVVTLTNDSGEPLEASGCGGYFFVTLQNADYVQQFAQPACLQPFTFPEGRSTYPVTLSASYTGCSADPDSSDDTMLRCLPGGGIPPLPEGEYLATVQKQGDIVDPPDPIEITIT